MSPLIGKAEPSEGIWRRRLLLPLIIVGVLLVSLWLTSAIVDLSIYAAYSHYIDTLKNHLGIDTYLANVLSLVFLVPFFLGIKYYLLSFRDRKRKQVIGIALLLSMGILYNLALYFGTRNEHFDTKGRSNKFYALVPGGVVFSDRVGTEPKYGVPFRPVTQENIKWLLRIQQGRVEEVSDPARRDWFDGVTRDPLLWYYADADGNLHFCDGPGYARATGAELKPVTAEIRQEWERKTRATAGAQPRADSEGFPRISIDTRSAAKGGPAAAPLVSVRPMTIEPRARRISEFRGLLNPVQIMTGQRNIAITIVATGAPSGLAPEQTLYGRLRQMRGRLITDLFRQGLVAGGYFDELYQGDKELLRLAAASSRVDSIVLGRLQYSCRKGGQVDNDLVSCEMTLDCKAIDQAGDVIKDDSFHVIGPGFSETAAIEHGTELLADQLYERVLKAIL